MERLVQVRVSHPTTKSASVSPQPLTPLRPSQLKSYYSARLQLREGALATLRKDLRGAQEIYPSRITAEVRVESGVWVCAQRLPTLTTRSQITDGVKGELEDLDKALRATDGEAIKQKLESFLQQLAAVIAMLEAMPRSS